MSLTIASVSRAEGGGVVFDVALIPTTLELTTLGQTAAGSRLNIETDILSKTVIQYLRRLGDSGGESVTLQTLREAAMYPDCMDVKTAQMILFAVLLARLAPAARIHGIAAKRAGATKEELHAVCGLTFLFCGLSAFNMGAEMIQEIWAEDEK